MHSLDQIYFYLTEGCNLACRHCWLAPKFDPRATLYPVLPVEFFAKAVREAKPLGLKTVKLTGGEPLMHPDIVTVLEIVRREELSLTIETNGVLCSPRLAVEIARSPNAFVSVSLDGTDSRTHDWIRGVPGAFQKALAGIRNLVEAGIAPQIIMSLMEANRNQVEAMVRLAETLGAGSVKFNIVQPTGRAEKAHGHNNALNISEIISLGRFVDTELAENTEMQLIYDLPLAFRPLSRIANQDGCGVCGILGIIGVLADGHYALCGIGAHVPELVFGSVKNDNLEEIWNENAFLIKLREGLPNRLEGICRSCLMKGRCLGSCLAQNYYRSRSAWVPYWLCSEASAQGLFPVSRLGNPPDCSTDIHALYGVLGEA